MWFQGSDVAPPKITVQPTAFPEAPRDTSAWRTLLSKSHGEPMPQIGGGAVVWGLSINKGCADMNLQVVLGHSGNRETGGKEHESADTTLLASLHE